MSIFLYTITSVIVVLLTFLLNYYIKNRRFWKLLEDFHGYKTLPIIGNAHQFGSTPEDFLWRLFDLFKEAGYTTHKFFIGPSAFVNICDPETIEVLLSSTKEIEKMTDYSYFKGWLGDGLLLSSGAKWKQRRKIITPTFHFKILEQFIKVFNDNGKILIDKFAKNTEKVVDIYPFINVYTLDVICETAMGVQINAQIESNSEYVKAIQSICRLIKRRIFSPLKRIPLYYRFTNDYRQYHKDLKVIHGMSKNVIKTRRNILKDQIDKVRNGESMANDQDEFIKVRKKIAFLDLLLLSKLPDGSFLSDEDVREETDTFMFEGHDTTASGISFAIYSLANNTDVQQKALNEVISIVGNDPSVEISYENLQNMKYMEMVIKESLRLYPSVPGYGRVLINDMKLPDGKTIPAGTLVTVDVFALGRNPRHHPDVEKFNPERFSPENTAGKSPYMHVPFSAGSRNCIGQKFAMLEMKCILAKLLLNYELLSAGEDGKLRLASEIILKTVTGVRIIIKNRKRHP